MWRFREFFFFKRERVTLLGFTKSDERERFYLFMFYLQGERILAEKNAEMEVRKRVARKV
jgi:hypothetical protein